MVPVANKPTTGKQKPPTPPKPVHFQHISAYKRLYESSKFKSPLLEIVDLHQNLNDTASDDTAPLIDEETDGTSANNNRVSKRAVKPPLLPKPQHIPTVKCTAATSLETEINTTIRVSPRSSPRSIRSNTDSEPELQFNETKANDKPSSNPFKNAASTTNSSDNPLNPFADEIQKELNGKNNLNPFTSESIETETANDERGVNLIEYLTSTTTTTISETRFQHKVKASTLSRVENIKNTSDDSFLSEFNRSFERATSTESTSCRFSSETTHLSKSFQSLDHRLSFDEIHKQFESDKESLLERNTKHVTSNLLTRRSEIKTDSNNLAPSLENDRSNRSSWRSSSSIEFADNHSQSSSVIDHEYWPKNSSTSKSDSSSSVDVGKSKSNNLAADESIVDDDKHENFDDDDSIGGNSSNDSYSVRRRIKTWFGSFGKAGKTVKRRDSVFYVENESDSKNNAMWETASVSSTEDKNVNNNDDSAIDNDKDNNSTATLNGNIDADEVAPVIIEESESDKEAKQEKKAHLVIKELISSEKVFIDVLYLLTDDFVNFIKNADKDRIIPETDLNRIINYLPQLKSFNEDLLKDFEGRMDNWTLYPKISDIIIKKGPFLKLFSTYIQNFEKQCNLLDDCCHKYHKFAKAVKDFESSERCKKLTLKHYMLKPVQRLPQYRLLLEDYLIHQNANSIDYNDTQQALRIVCDVAEHANKSMEQDLHLSKLLEIQNRLGNHEIIKPGRIFIKEGELYKFSRKELQSRYFILLNDCLLYTSYGSMFNLTVKEKIPLAGMKVWIPSVEDYHNEFNIMSTTRSFTLRAKSAQEREDWVSVIEKTIQEHHKKQLSFCPTYDPTDIIGKKAPVWIPDHRVTMCQICTAEFKVTFRRHHCRACGRVVCGLCSDNKAPLQYMNFQAARVCDDCFQYLLKEFEEKSESILNIIKNNNDLNDSDAFATYQSAKISFKKHDPHNSKKPHRNPAPSWLKEVTANDSGSQISGWLHRKNKNKSWKRNWFVLKEQVLYVYKASEDVMASESVPVLGYVVETFKEASNSYEDIDSKLVFQLGHAGQPPLVFYADSEIVAEKWVAALREATSLIS
ncbi:FYVE, RhoGEF and PH domain-containing protein 6-like [Planococcus citri]|uniref:FYVE, RhoGEF and PH domain-containing protein 6-like n=1 Tax=Planococcus citri TaxID=170843 RepID=UPI0031F935A2